MAVTIGKVLRRLRQARDWTLADAAEETKKHGRFLIGTTISRHEQGKQRPTTDVLEVYARTYGVGTSSDLLRLTHEGDLLTSKEPIARSELTYAQVSQVTERLTRVLQDLIEIIRLLGSAPTRPPDSAARPSIPEHAPPSRDGARRLGKR